MYHPFTDIGKFSITLYNKLFSRWSDFQFFAKDITLPNKKKYITQRLYLVLFAITNFSNCEKWLNELWKTFKFTPIFQKPKIYKDGYTVSLICSISFHNILHGEDIPSAALNNNSFLYLYNPFIAPNDPPAKKKSSLRIWWTFFNYPGKKQIE